MASPPGIPYNWKNGKIKLWDTTPPSSSFATSTGTGSTGFQYQQWVNSRLAPFSQDWNSGYDATATSISSDNWKSLLNHANANFCNAEYYVPLFVNAVQIDLGISGSTAQAHRTRDFYPHNITIPSFTISGQCYSTAHYGALTEYIHMAQHHALTHNNGTPDLVQFYLSSSVGTAPEGGRTSGPHVALTLNGTTTKAYNQKIVGGHSEIMCLGYISTIARTHATGEHRPSWQAEFIVVQMLRSPLFTEQTASEKETGTWLSILSGTKSQDWLDKYNEANNVKTLRGVSAGANSAISSLGGGSSA